APRRLTQRKMNRRLRRWARRNAASGGQRQKPTRVSGWASGRGDTVSPEGLLRGFALGHLLAQRQRGRRLGRGRRGRAPVAARRLARVAAGPAGAQPVEAVPPPPALVLHPAPDLAPGPALAAVVVAVRGARGVAGRAALRPARDVPRLP